MPHKSVLLNEVINSLKIQKDRKYLDCTFGAGGYSKAILNKGGIVYACDQDLSTYKYFENLKKDFDNKINFFHSNFAEVNSFLIESDINELDGIVMDLGVSSMQLDNAERGFSFNKEGPLDMRMNNESEKSAYDFVNKGSFEELADVIFYYGDEREARKIAHAIIKFRENEEIKTTLQLTNIIHRVLGFNKNYKIDPATKTFQAIRIFVNDEMNNLIIGLQKLVKMLSIGGRIVVVTFHSIEDGIVKQFFKTISKKEFIDVYKMIDKDFYNNFGFAIEGNVVTPSEDEINENIRARSAKMRVLRREF